MFILTDDDDGYVKLLLHMASIFPLNFIIDTINF